MAAQISWFWSDQFWLPNNVSWSDLNNTDKAVYPRIQDFYAVLPFALALLVIRIAFERCIATPLAHIVGIKSKNHYDAMPNTILEKVFKSVTKNPERKRLEGLAKQLDWSVRNVERWFRRRRNQDRPSMIVKFTETCWRSVFYIGAFSYGMYSIPTQPWFWDLRLCWHHFPFHPVTSQIYNYYMLEMSFYSSLILSLFTDVRRKDFIPQFIHHITSIVLMAFSWTCNFTRVGCIVLLTHDISDIFLEVGKLCAYAKAHSASNALFGVFSFVFFVTRIIFLPLGIIYSALFESVVIIGSFPAYYLFNGLLLILQALDSYWFVLIACMAYRVLVRGQITQDERSDVEESNSEGEEAEETNGKVNHNHNYTNHASSNYKPIANHH